MRKSLFGWLVFCLLSPLAFAEDVQLNPNHPDTHVVVEGDTLWDISSTFLQSPWLWPEIWHANPQIANPHLIYPGDVVSLIYLDGKPKLKVTRGKQTIKLQPTARITPLRMPIPAIPLDAIAPFLNRSRVVSGAEIEASPYVVAGDQRRIVLGAGDQLYARGEFDDANPAYAVFRKGDPYIDPDTQENLGISAKDIALTKVLSIDDDIATLHVNTSNEEIRIGDHLLPTDEGVVDSTFHPSRPDGDVDGTIIAVLGNGVTQVGQYHVVAINRGEREGIKRGNVLSIHQKGEIVKDRKANELIQLPDQRAGIMMIFRTFEKVSLGLVLKADRPLAVLDKVHNP